jgi:hypothetical protein
LTDESNATTNGKLLSDAVTSANAHSDLQFGKVQTKVGDLGGKVESVGKKTEALGDALAKAAGDINTNLGKVGKPDPTPPPKIVFTFTDTPSNPNDPLRSETIKPNEDGTYSFKFNAVNNSDIIAEQVEAWVSICKVCEFVGEPKGSDHPPGEIAQMRHFVFGSMNAGVAHGDTSVTFKVTPTTVHAPFGVTFAYACKTCNKPHHEPDYILNVDYSSPPTKQP